MRNKNLLFHKALLFSLAMLLSGYTTKAEELIATINLSSPISSGIGLNIELRAQQDNTPIKFDYGNGVLVEKTVNSEPTQIYDGLPNDGSNQRSSIIKIYGETTDLISFSCSYQHISAIDITANSNLRDLDLSNNDLERVDISQNTKLEKLILGHNNIQNIDLSNNPSLTQVWLATNQLTELNIDNNPSIERLSCAMNQFRLSTLPLPRESFIEYYREHQNNISIEANYNIGDAIDLSSENVIEGHQTLFRWFQGNIALEEGVDYTVVEGVTTFLRYVSGNISCLLSNDLFPHTMIQTSSFTMPEQNNPYQLLVTLTRDASTLGDDFNFSLAVAANKENSSIRISFGENTSIETPITNEQSVYRFETKATGKTYLWMGGEKQVAQDGENPRNITEIKIYGNPNDFSRLFCRQGFFSSIDVSNATSLEYLNCEFNNIENIDLSNNSMLKELYCSNNRLTQLDLSQNREITILSCYHNNLETINTNQNTKLEKLYCNNNDITELNFENNDLLRVLDCRYNHMLFSVIYPILQKPELLFSYDFQTIILNETYRKGETVDFATEQSFGGYPTYVTWYSNDEVLEEGVDYISANGQTTFIRNIQGTLRATLFNYYFRQQNQIFTTTFDMPISTSIPEWESNNRQVFGTEKQIVIKGLERNAKIQVFNTIGVHVRSLNTNQNDINIPVAHAGIYLLRIQEKGKGNSYKVIVQ
ncbi:MAG: T9SS type A sorting domain-containing protein [Prolixibacteraceae bacterium]|jgi:Leucine-rich repeat (LRR) protein|nr:T9SS type A sorting domain-containing protein [Prolixibacteraceae bacterium]